MGAYLTTPGEYVLVGDGSGGFVSFLVQDAAGNTLLSDFISASAGELDVTVGAPQADMAVSLTGTPNVANVHDPLTFLATVTNSGPSTAPLVQLALSLPPEIAFVSAAPSQGSCSGLACDLGDLAPSSNATVSIFATASSVGIGTTSALASSSASDADQSNNSASVTTTIVDACAPGTRFLGVMLPQVTIPIAIPTKPWQVEYGSLSLDFQAEAAPAGALCEVHSNQGSLAVLARPTLITGVGPFAPFATETADAFLTIYDVGTIPSGLCDFSATGGVYNGCALNGPIAPDPSDHYVQWTTSGFTTTFVESLPQPFSTGPLSFWVDLDALSLSPGANSMDEIIRKVEPYIHIKLIQNLPAVLAKGSALAYVAYTIIQDPGLVTIRVSSGSQTTGVLGDGGTEVGIPASLYYPSVSNPGVLLADPSPGTYQVLVTGVESGTFSLSASTTVLPNGVPNEQVFSQTIAKGATLAYQVILTASQGALGQQFASRPDGSLAALIGFVDGLALANGLTTSLEAKLRAAATSLGDMTRPNRTVAAGQIGAFLNEVSAQADKKLSADAAATLQGWGQNIVDQIGNL